MPRHDALVTLSLDTSALIAIQAGEPRAPWVAEQLDAAHSLLVCAPVIAELRPSLPDAENWVTSFGIDIDWEFSRAMWQRIGDLHAEYALRRQKAGAGLPRRLVTDFLIGAHAEVRGYPLLTLNPADYAMFTDLTLVQP